MSHRYGIFSWWWAYSCLKHVDKSNKHIKKICAPSWFYLQDYTRMHSQQNIKHSWNLIIKSWNTLQSADGRRMKYKYRATVEYYWQGKHRSTQGWGKKTHYHGAQISLQLLVVTFTIIQYLFLIYCHLISNYVFAPFHNFNFPIVFTLHIYLYPYSKFCCYSVTFSSTITTHW